MSQKLDQQNDFVYTFDQATPDASFNWNDTNTKVSFTCNSKVELGLVDSNRIIYRLQFVSPFKDSGAAKSVKNRFINFNGQTFGDYVNFSIKTSN